MHNMYHGFHLSTHFLKIEEIVQCIGNFLKEDNEKKPDKSIKLEETTIAIIVFW